MGPISSVKLLIALSIMVKARNGCRYTQRLPSARRSERQVLRAQRSRCLKKTFQVVGNVDHTSALRCM